MSSLRPLIGKHRYLSASLAVVLGTLFLVPFRHVFDFAHLAWLYLCVVGFVAWLFGTGPALLAAMLSFTAGTYFTPPIGAFWVSKPLDFLQLLIFFLGAAVVGTLTGQVRKRELAALESERDATALARLASEMAKGHSVDAIVGSAVECLRSEDDVADVTVWLKSDDGTLMPHARALDSFAHAARTAASRSFDELVAINLSSSAYRPDRLVAGWPSALEDPRLASYGTFIPICSSLGCEGVLQVTSREAGVGDRTAALAVSISQLLGVFISSEKANELSSKMRGAEEAARIKAVIVSAVSHELKTPLSAAMASVTDLIADDVTREAGQVKESLIEVAEDLGRLKTAISDLLDLSRLQSDEWMSQPDIYEAGEILGDVIAPLPDSLRERLVFRVKERPAPQVYADFAQVSRALRSILDNAVVYSPEGSPIFVGAERGSDTTVIWIEDRGPGVSESDKPFIFDRAYRGEAGVRRAGSTGLGLTIAHDLIAANGGRLLVEDSEPRGTRILVELPVAGRGVDDE